jgi:hypothetical protein
MRSIKKFFFFVYVSFVRQRSTHKGTTAIKEKVEGKIYFLLLDSALLLSVYAVALQCQLLSLSFPLRGL